MNVLLAIDGSKQSLFAEQVLQEFPFQTPPDLNILTVCPSGDLHPLGAEIPAMINSMVDKCRESATELLSQSAQRCSDWAASVSTTLLDGHPAYEISHLIEGTHPDLVVLGSHGYGATKRFLLGSVSDRIASHAHCPVLITRDHEQTPEVKTILIADDGSEKAEAAVKRIAGFPLKGRTVVLLSVLETLNIYGMDEVLLASPEWEEHRAETNIRLQQHQKLLSQTQADVQIKVMQSSQVADSIASVAEELFADLIVVGSAGKSGIRKFLLGSVSQRILHHSPCSVWIERT